MTPDQATNQWIEDYFSTFEGSKCHFVAKGFVAADIEECGGYPQWFALTPSQITDSFSETLDEVSDNLVNDYALMVDQESMLDSLNIGQSFTIDPVDLMKAYKSGISDVFVSMSIYFEVWELAKDTYYMYSD